MKNLRTLSALDSEIEAIALFLRDHLFVLPSMPLSMMERFPRIQCIYFVVSGSVVYYIGCTKNLYLRWLRHHKEEESLQLNDPVVYWFACPGLSINDSFRLEQSLLREIPTQLNQVRPKPDRHLWHRVEKYLSHQISYYRYRWGKGKETWGYLHIPGGSCTDDVVQSRKKLIEDAIALGDSPEQIKKLFLAWESAPAGRKPAF